MKRFEDLPEIAGKSLSGLTAGQNLKYRIEHAAREGSVPQRRKLPAWAPALCCALVLALGLTFALPALDGTRQGGDDAGQLMLSTRAGESTDSPRTRALDLPAGSITLTEGSGTPSYRSIWSDSTDGNFPLIGLNGKYYRMLANPDAVSDSMLGGSMGTVSEFTTEPSLSGSDVIMSNKVGAGETVYAISGMDGTLVAAKVGDVYRVFQRVGYNGSAIKGSEGLSDTLQISGHVLALELSGVGTITDSDTAETLVSTLLSNASYESSGSISGKQSLLIQLDNGLTVQLAVKDDKLSACGTWSCPEFIDAFTAAVQ